MTMTAITMCDDTDTPHDTPLLVQEVIEEIKAYCGVPIPNFDPPREIIIWQKKNHNERKIRNAVSH